MIVIGSTGLIKTVDRGQFYCPQCDEVDLPYHEKTVRRWLTLYWIPVIPMSGHKPFVECDNCGGQFEMDVLEITPPTESERFMNKLFRSMEAGMSLSKAKEKLAEIGMDSKSADGWIETFTKDKSWECTNCREQFVNTVKRCPACNAKKPR